MFLLSFFFFFLALDHGSETWSCAFFFFLSFLSHCLPSWLVFEPHGVCPCQSVFFCFSCFLHPFSLVWQTNVNWVNFFNSIFSIFFLALDYGSETWSGAFFFPSSGPFIGLFIWLFLTLYSLFWSHGGLVVKMYTPFNQFLAILEINFCNLFIF